MALDAELLQGARNAVRVCMNVGGQDRVFIATDEETNEVGQAIEQEAAATGAAVATSRLEDFGPRPMTALPEALGLRIREFGPSVTFLAVSAKEGELPLRGEFMRLVMGKLGVRHAHMPTVTSQIMREGMRADYRKVNELTQRVLETVRQARSIRVTSANGTNVTAGFDDSLKWVGCGGLYHRAGEWGNLPEGEVFTCPATVDGVVVAEVLGDYFSPRYGVLSDPVTFEIEAGRAVRVSCRRKDLESELLAYLDSDDNGRRVGEFAIGTNTGLNALSGVLLQDEKIPGLHVAFGNPYPDVTGADWRAKTHIDVIPSRCAIDVDGQALMRDGTFTLPG
jgi:leucyl aminopeptidase (aminopeptidase T)